MTVLRGRVVSRVGPALLAILLLGGCSANPAEQPAPTGPPLPTTQASLSAQVSGTVALLRAALAGAGLQLQPATQPYRPSEPASLVQAPRAVFQESLSDPNAGFVVIYDLSDPAVATSRAREFAGYLGSGFGQTNYPFDAQFSIAQVGGTIVFTWWSPSVASNEQLAEAGFDAVASVGQAIPVTK
jgi:hypothetical protein